MLHREFTQENRMEKFEEAYGRWKAGETGQRTAAVTLGMRERTFRRYRRRREDEGVEGLRDRRIGSRGPRGASREEVRALEALYRDCYEGRNVRHFYEAYTELHGGVRSCSWVKDCLHAASLVKRRRRRGPYRQCREREGKPGDMLHQEPAGTVQARLRDGVCVPRTGGDFLSIFRACRRRNGLFFPGSRSTEKAGHGFSGGGAG